MNKLIDCLKTLALTAWLLSIGAGAALADGDAEKGKILAYTCLGCHGIEGYRNAYPSYRVPKLGGQSDAYVQIALKAYRSGERNHPTMVAQAASLNDENIADLAAYFAAKGSVEVAAAPELPDSPLKEKVGLCTACHGSNGVGVTAEWPTLSGQHEDYLVNALLQYQGKAHSERKNAIMAGLVGALTKQEVAALAKYYASFDGLYTTKEE